MVAGESPEFVDAPWTSEDPAPAWEPSDVRQEEPVTDPIDDGPGIEPPGDDDVVENEAPDPGGAPSKGAPSAESRYGRRRTRRR